MDEILNNLVENVAQCWGCAVFDNLFNVVSSAGAVVYNKIADICFAIFAALFVFYIVWAVFKYLNPKKPDTSDKYYTKTVVRVVINSLFALALLGIGVGFPRFITRVTFEPVADVTLLYTQSVLKAAPEFVDAHVRIPSSVQIKTDGLYRPELRDSIVKLMQTTVSQLQSYMKFGFAVIEKSFEWSEMITLGAIIRHIIMFFVGLYLLYYFFKLFIRFCFYFVDVIVHMAMFAFLFPIALVMMSFRGGDMPDWMSSLGRGLGTDQIKKLLGAIVSLGAAVITYLVIIVIIARFFSDSGVSDTELMNAITSGEVFNVDLSGDNMATFTLVGTIVLLYVLNYISGQIQNVKKMILAAFGATEQNELSEKMADDAEKLVGLVTNSIKSVGNKIINPDKKDENKK